jgi:hypothetical protein
MRHVWGRGLGWSNPGEKKPLGRPRRIWNYNIKLDLQKQDELAWTGLIWLRIGTGNGLF